MNPVPTLDQASHKQLYDDRYAGDYMDTDSYGSWSRESLGRLKVAQTLAQVPTTPRRILDYGCGTGGWIGLLGETFAGAELCGIDVSENAVAKAHEKYPRATFAPFDGARAPFPDASFDLVFSYHVLEHVLDIDATIRDIGRLLEPGGSACIIFPCGNAGSLEEQIVRRQDGGIVPSADGRTVWLHEIPFGHLRRMKSAETIALFERSGMKLVCEWYFPIVFGSIDFICRSTGPAYINEICGRTPVDLRSKLWLGTVRRSLLLLYKLLQKKSLDTEKKRSFPKQAAVHGVKALANFADDAIVKLARWEWRTRRERRAGSAQYLVFTKR